ncbi:MAG TPA: hypothetical protein PKE51_00730 [Gemmatimonadaceae bacterium]|nr:hypothetical protein [Gemmatimonadaceae bacterium]
MPLECLPQSDPTRYLPLRSADSVSLVQAFSRLRAQAEFASPTDWSVCLELFTTVTSLYFVKKAVFRGKPDSTEGHDGQLVRDTLHIDADYFDFVNSNRTGENLANLLGLALHEAGHSIRKADGSAKYEHSSNLQPGSYPFPFSLTSPDVAGGIPNSCAKP